MFDVQGFILVGGASSRMGSDKAQLKFHGQTGVELIAAALRPNVVAVRSVGSREEASLSQLQNVPDLHERWGALGGIQAALYACQSAWAAIVACDLPLVTDELFARLWQFAKEPFDAVVPLQPDGRQQPLCAFYRRERCLAATDRLIASDEHTPRVLLASVPTRWVEFSELADLPNAEHFFLNVNTPADYERAIQILALQNREQ